MIRILLSRAPLLLFCLFAWEAGAADEGGSVRLETRVQRIVDDVDGFGQPLRRYLDEALVTPGDLLRYAIAYRNDSAFDVVEADTLVITTPVPESLVFVPGSAAGVGTAISLSRDGGETFSAPSPGAAASRGAAPVTHVRWRVLDALEPGAGGEVAFEARLE
jgi:uncharacterized repeat protein (TIGR01451 family)